MRASIVSPRIQFCQPLSILPIAKRSSKYPLRGTKTYLEDLFTRVIVTSPDVKHSCMHICMHAYKISARIKVQISCTRINLHIGSCIDLNGCI